MKGPFLALACMYLFAQDASAAFIYNFAFTTSADASNTGLDGEVRGYFSLPDDTFGIISGVDGALRISELVVTSDTTGSGFEAIGVNLLTYVHPTNGVLGFDLSSYNNFLADGMTATGQLIYASHNGVSSGGPFASGLFFGLFEGGAVDDRVGGISWNPDGDASLDRRKFASGRITLGDSISITAGNETPEPASLALFGIGGLGLLVARRRRRESSHTAN